MFLKFVEKKFEQVLMSFTLNTTFRRVVFCSDDRGLLKTLFKPQRHG